MKIALVSSLVYPDELGGVESYLFRVAPALAKQAEVVIITGTRSGTGSFPGEIEKSGVGIRIVELRNASLYPLWDFRRHNGGSRLVWHAIDFYNPHTTDELLDVLRQERPDIVHTHNVRGISLSSFLAVDTSGLPHVHTLHDFLLLSPLANLRLGNVPASPTLPVNRLYQLYTRSLTRA